MITTKILCVDDDANLLAGIQRNLRKRFDLETTVDSLQALQLMKRNGPYAVVVADMQMPGINGIEFLNLARQQCPDTVRIMLTGNADQGTAIEAVNQGQIFQFLTKPCPSDHLAKVLDDGLARYRQVMAERELLEQTLNGSVKVLMETLALVDAGVFGRSQTLRDYTRQLAQTMQLPFTWELELAAMLSQIGFVSVPPALNQKARAGFGLTGAERDILSRVPQVGSDLLTNIPRLKTVARIVLYQGKHFDGSGLPLDSIKGAEIPIESRIITALTDLIQLESGRIPKFKALEQMRQSPGRYDPEVLDAMCRSFELGPQNATAPQTSGKAVQAIELRPGHMLLSDIKTLDDVLIVTAGNRITPLLLERLKNFAAIGGLKEPIYIAI